VIHIAAQDLLTLCCVHEGAIGAQATRLDYLNQGIAFTQHG
jgi:hypothetical protein